MNNDCIINNFCTEYCDFYGSDETDKNKKELYITYVICELAKISHCHAQIFAKASQRLSCEIEKAQDLNELKTVLDLTNDFMLTFSHFEKSMAKFFEAVKCPGA